MMSLDISVKATARIAMVKKWLLRNIVSKNQQLAIKRKEERY